MANEDQLAILRQGVAAWNTWISSDSGSEVDLSWANLSGLDLRGVCFRWTNLFQADLRGARLDGAELFRADLTMADATGAQLADADFTGAIFTSPNPGDAMRCAANLTFADLHGANLAKVDLTGVKLARANLRGAHLSGSTLEGVDLTEADLTDANLMGTLLVGTNLRGANLSGCKVYAISSWDVSLEGAIQTNLRITPPGELAITVDNLQVAQFLYLILNNQEIRAALDTITSKVVLILGRFSKKRKPALDALRLALRQHPNGYVPVLFDFEPQADKPVLETVKILANLARFVIADLTDPNMVRSELTAITASVPTVPIRPLIEGEAPLPTETEAWAAFRSFLPIYRYRDIPQLLAALDEAVIAPVEQFVRPRPIVERPS